MRRSRKRDNRARKAKVSRTLRWLEPVERNVRMSQKVVEQLKRLIQEERLPPGQKLPPEKELAQTLGVSRATLREALNILEALGYVDIRPREGSVVRSRLPAEPVEQDAGLVRRNPDILFELFEMRRKVDAAGAAMAAERATAEERRKLAGYAEQMKLLTSGGRSIFTDEAGAVYIKTFFLIGRATHNMAYSHVMASAWTLVDGAVSYSRDKLVFVPAISRQLVRQYLRIVKAIIEGKPAQAERAVIEHIRFAETQLRRVLDAERRVAAPDGGGEKDGRKEEVTHGDHGTAGVV